MRYRGLLQLQKQASAMQGYAQHWAGLPPAERWSALQRHITDPTFVKEVQRAKVPAVLKRQIDLIHRQRVGRPRAKVQATPVADGGTDGRKRYDIGYDRHRRRWTCSCADWMYRRSAVSDSAGAAEKNCKHIRLHLRRSK